MFLFFLSLYLLEDVGVGVVFGVGFLRQKNQRKIKENPRVSTILVLNRFKEVMYRVQLALT
jgi:predicted membrane protein